MKLCIASQVEAKICSDGQNVNAKIIGAEGYEIAIYCLINGVKVHEIWYSRNYDLTIPVELFSSLEGFQIQVFVRFDSSDAEPKSIKSNVLGSSNPIFFDGAQQLLSALEGMVQMEPLAGVGIKKILEDKNYLDREARILSYEMFFDGIASLKVANKDFFDFAVIDGFWSLCNVSYGWIGEHEGLGIPPFAWYEKIENSLECHFKKGQLSSCVFFTIKAVLASVREDWSLAEDFFKKSNYPVSKHMGHFFGGGASFRHPLVALREHAQRLDFSEVIKLSRNDVCSIPFDYNLDFFVFSTEPNYFNRFAIQVVSSALAHTAKVDFLFFIIGEVDLCAKTMNELEVLCSLSNSKCHYMVGKTSYELLPVAASARFLAAHEVLSRTNSQVFVFDIDMFVTSEMGRDIENISKNRKLALSLKTNGARSFPWTNIAAAGTFFPQGAQSMFFVRAVCNYFLEVLSRDSNNWWIDQNALFAAYKQFKYLYYSVDVVNMHSTTGKGLSKNEDSELVKWKRAMKKL
jgi:hypothetical protein